MATAELKQPRTSGIKFNAKQAARLSLEYFNELFPNAVASNVALEEVEFLEDDNCWLITLGFDEPKKISGIHLSGIQMSKSITDLFGPASPARKFKIFKVNAKTGRVLSMRIRKID
jgi:hypothetical protein